MTMKLKVDGTSGAGPKLAWHGKNLTTIETILVISLIRMHYVLCLMSYVLWILDGMGQYLNLYKLT